MKNLNKKFKEKGFTLIELLMVSFLLSILGVSIMQVVTQIQAATQTAEEKRTLIEQNLKAFTAVRSQLIAPGLSPLPPLNQNAQTPSSQAGQGFQARAFGMNRTFEVIEIPNSGQMLRFTSLSSSFASPLNRELYGEVEVRLYVDIINNEGVLILELWNLQNNLASQNQLILNEPLSRMPLLNNVQSIRFRSFNFNSWQENWDNPYAPKPSLLEMTIVRSLDNGALDIFRGAVSMYQSR